MVITPEVKMAFAQLFSIGLLFITLHCSGMCGPLMIGLDVGQTSQKVTLLRAFTNTLIYQSGRALTYLFLGALAGFLGASMERFLASFGSFFILLMGISLLGYSLYNVLPLQRQKVIQIGDSPSKNLFERFLGKLSQYPLFLPTRRSLLETAFLGILLGLMPCMITLWVLGLAVATASPFYGSLLMLCLVIMTIPIISLSALSTRLIPMSYRRYFNGFHLYLLGFSGCWLILIALGGLELIPHAHWEFYLLNDNYTIMFW